MFRVYIHVSSRGLEGLESRLNARFGERSRRLSSGMLYCVQRSCEAAGITEGPKDRVVRAHARGLANGHGLLDARGTRPERVGRLATADCSSVAACAAGFQTICQKRTTDRRTRMWVEVGKEEGKTRLVSNSRAPYDVKCYAKFHVKQ